jgi:hypothetical protein
MLNQKICFKITAKGSHGMSAKIGFIGGFGCLI